MSGIFLSIIIPAHNEERRLPGTLGQVLEFVRSQPYRSEVLVVENASRDRTLEIARGAAQQHPEVCVLQEAVPGKGRAVRRGMLAAQGEFRFMCDADLSMPVSEIPRFLPPLLTGCELAIGSREAPGAVRYNEPLYRHLGGRLVNTMIRWLALPGMQDSQCGFKCFQAAAAEDLFGVQRMEGWSFDIELLYVARRRGYKIVEIPIPWYFNPESKLSAVRDAIHMAQDILKIRLNDLQGRYARKV